MKKYLLLVFFSLGLGQLSQVMAQSFQSIKNSYAPLAPWVPSGILYDRSPFNLLLSGNWYNSANYDGTADSTCSVDAFKALHQAKFHECFTEEAILKFKPEDFNAVVNKAFYGTDVSNWTAQDYMNHTQVHNAVLGFLDLDFHAITIDAMSNAWIGKNNNGLYELRVNPYQISDTLFLDTINFSTHPDSIVIIDTTYYPDSAMVVQNAFEKYRLFALGVLTSEVYAEGDDPIVDFNLGDSLLISNKSNINYEIDWDNGNGFVPFDANIRVFSIQYSSYGLKTIRIRTANQEPSDTHPYLYSNTTFMLGRVSSSDVQVPVPTPVGGDICERSTAEHGVGDGIITIRYAPGRNNILKPIIFVEGFDQLNPASPETDLEYLVNGRVAYGGLHWFSLSSGSIAGNYPNLAFFPNLIDSLQNEGFDIIYLDFKTNRAKIQKNANLLINVIDYLNSHLKLNNSDEGIAVMGASMGGLIARYAIRQMELSECCHNVYLYGTFSTPHQGANIPLGIQELLKYLGNDLGEFNRPEAKNTYDNILNSPSARQTLVYHIDPSAANERTAFQNELDLIGQPKHTRRVVLTDGSQTGQNQSDGSNNLLIDNQRLMNVNVKVWRPTELRLRDLIWVPAEIKTLKDIRDGLLPSSSVPFGDWTMLKADAYAIGNNPNGNSQTILSTGRAAQDNYNAYMGMFDYYEKQANKLAINSVLAYLSPPPLSLFFAAKATRIKSISSTVLVAMHSLNESQNSILQNKLVSYPTLPYDNCPGDFAPTQAAIVRFSGGLAKSDFPHHNFIATVSALDIDTTSLYLNIWANQEYLIENEIPFEAYWAEGTGQTDPISNNRPHVFFQAVNVSWINQKQREAIPVFLTQSSSSKLDTYFNFALKEDQTPNDKNIANDKLLRTVEIKSEGILHVNKHDEVGYLNSGIGLPEAFGSFDIITEQGACEPPVVTIQDGAFFIVGDDNYIPVANGIQDNNKAKVFFAKGSKLIVEDGGTLRINDNSSLIIEEGSEIVLHNGATIHLDGALAVLEIKGKINLQDDAVLTSTGSGFIRFAQPNVQSNVQDYWQVGIKTKLIFTGAGKHDKRVEVLNKLKIPATVSDVKFENCKVEIGVNDKLQIHGVASIDNTLFTKITNQTGRYGEVTVYGQSGLSIKNSEFRNGTIGLLGLLSGANAISVQNCDFKQCATGISIIDKNLQLINCRADSNDVGLSVANASAACDVRNSQFNRNSFAGISFSGTSSSLLNMFESSARFNEIGLYVTANTNVRLTCNQITSNDYGVFLENAGLDIANEARNNFIANAQAAIYFEGSTRLALRNGYNNFGDGQYYLYGNFGTFSSGMDFCALGGLDVLNNRMPQVNGQLPVYLRTKLGATCTVLNWQPMLPLALTACPAVALMSYEATLIQQTPTTIVVSTPYYNGLLTAAISDALGDITDNFVIEIREDDKAVLKLVEVFSAIRQNYAYRESSYSYGLDLTLLSTEESKLMLMAFDAAIRAIGNAYRFGLLESNGAQEQGEMTTQLSRLVEELDYLFNFYSSEYDEANWFKYSLAKAQIYRAGEHYDYAQNALDLIETENDVYGPIRDFWSCVFEGESQYIQGVISEEDFRLHLDYCIGNSIELRRGRLEGEGIAIESLTNNSKSQVVLYPNPASERFSLWFSDNLYGYQLELVRMDGKIVSQYSIPANKEEITIELKDISPGFYVVRIADGVRQSEVRKLIVAK